MTERVAEWGSEKVAFDSGYNLGGGLEEAHRPIVK